MSRILRTTVGAVLVASCLSLVGPALGAAASPAPAFEASNVRIAAGSTGTVSTTGPSAARGALLVSTRSELVHLVDAGGADCESVAGTVTPTWVCGDNSSTWDLDRDFTFAVDAAAAEGRVIENTITLMSTPRVVAPFTIEVGAPGESGTDTTPVDPS